MGEGIELLEANTDALLGPAPAGRKVRIMVTMASDAATDYELGARSRPEWHGLHAHQLRPRQSGSMAGHDPQSTEGAGRDRPQLPHPDGCRRPQAAHRPDRAGPLGDQMPAQARRLRSRRDSRSHLAHSNGQSRTGSRSRRRRAFHSPPAFSRNSGPATKSAFAMPAKRSARCACLRLWAEVAGPSPSRRFISCQGSKCAAISADKITGSDGVPKSAQTRIGKLPALPQTLLLKPGDTLILRRENTLGRPATYRKTGELIAPAQIGVSLPQMLDHAKPGEPVWFDDGKIGGVIRSVDSDSVSVEITQARPEGEKLGGRKRHQSPGDAHRYPGAHRR